MTGFLHHWAPTIIAAGSAAAVAFAGQIFTDIGPWYRNLRKPPWQPPDWLFGPAWTIIFICAAIAGVVGWHAMPNSAATAVLLSLFAVNGVLNVLWSVFFFAMKRPDFAMREVGFLWLSIAALMVVLAIYTGLAWLYLLPYLLWVSFASFLNYTIVRLNAPFEQAG